jgi:hypothetical protein
MSEKYRRAASAGKTSWTSYSVSKPKFFTDSRTPTVHVHNNNVVLLSRFSIIVYFWYEL